MSEEETSQELTFFTPRIRRVWHHDEWYYSVVDIIAVLTDSKDPATYWRVLKKRLSDEGASEILEQIEPLKLQAADHRFRLTDTAHRQALLRLIQSVPSPRAEPVRLWLAQVGEERLEEIEHPEAAIERVRERYRAKGYDEEWIESRIKNDLTRNELTDEWKLRGARDIEYSILTNEITKGTFDFSVQAYKQYKVLPDKANLRDHMDILELALCSLSEATAVTLHRARDSHGFPELKKDATDAGKAGGEARKSVEKTIGRSVVSQQNFLHLQSRKKVKGNQQQESEQSTKDLPEQGQLF